MEQVHLKYGTSAVDFEVDGAKSVKYLYENKMRVIEDIKAEFLHCVTDGVIGTKPLKELIAPTDPVTIVISDMTRFWMRQDVICELLVKYLHDEMGVEYDQIAVVVALGTHRKNTAEECRAARGGAEGKGEREGTQEYGGGSQKTCKRVCLRPCSERD